MEQNQISAELNQSCHWSQKLQFSSILQLEGFKTTHLKCGCSKTVHKKKHPRVSGKRIVDSQTLTRYCNHKDGGQHDGPVWVPRYDTFMEVLHLTHSDTTSSRSKRVENLQKIHEMLHSDVVWHVLSQTICCFVGAKEHNQDGDHLKRHY